MRLIPQTLIPAFLRSRTPRQAIALFETVSMRARTPVYHMRWGVPDEMEGRLEVLEMHLAALYRRLSRIAPHGADLWRDVLDHAMAEIERAMRDVGVGDVTVPKKMRRIAEGFYGRAKAYGDALDANDRTALIAAVSRNVFGEETPNATPSAGASTDPSIGPSTAASPAPLADDLIALAAALDAAPDAELMKGRFDPPAPFDAEDAPTATQGHRS